MAAMDNNETINNSSNVRIINTNLEILDIKLNW